MKHSKFKEELHKVEYDIKYICDWCGEPEDNEEIYTKNYFDIEWDVSDGLYPEGGSGVKKHFDLCFACRVKIFDKFTEMGIKVQETEWDI